MKIAMVSEHASPLATLGGVDAGGQNVHVAQLARALADDGHRVTVYTRRDCTAIDRKVPMADGVDVVHLPCGPPVPLAKDELLPHMSELSRGLRHEFRRTQPDIVHAHFWMSGLAMLRAVDELPIPTAITFHALGSEKRRHQGVNDTSPPERVKIEAAIARSVDTVVATSQEEVFELIRMGVWRRRVVLVPCGVDTARFTPAGPREPRGSTFAHRIVIVSRLVERKGIGNVIAALQTVPDTELVIAGGPDAAHLASDCEAQRLQRLASTLGVADRVEIRGRVNRAEVPALLRSADVVVCAPWYEPFGMVSLEAMACGVAVVATAVGGHVDTILHGVTGVHVPPRDVPALAEALRALLADPALCATLGRNGAVRARSRYDWSAIAAETVRAYSAASPITRSEVRQVG